MVCLGNICRSPMAHGILQNRIDKLKLPWKVESSGTSSWHAGEPPHTKSIAISKDNSIDITNQKSEHFKKEMLDVFDFVLVMDRSNYNDVMRLTSTENQKFKVKLLMDFAYPDENREVPDPYYEGGFKGVFSMIEKAVDAFIKVYAE